MSALLALAITLAPLSLFVSEEAPERLSRWLALEPSFERAEPPAARVWVLTAEPPVTGCAAGVACGRRLLLGLGERVEGRASLRYTGPADHPLAALDWNGAPQVALRARLLPGPGEEALVLTEDGEPFLLAGPEGLRLGLVLAEENRQFVEWPALPYLLYASTVLAAGEAPAPFSEWGASPLPGGAAGVILGAISAGLFLCSLLLFALARRALRAKAAGLAVEEEFCRVISAPAQGARWNRIGFSRPLAGFLFFLVTQLLFILALGWITEWIFPNLIQPFPAAAGMWGWITTSFAVIWYLFDAGTYDAFIKLFAERRLTDPRGALRCAQFFVWWQLLTGALQIALIGLLVLGPLPRSSLALYAWPLFLHAASQWPGVQNIFSAYFRAAQRFDYAQLLEVVVGWALGLIVPIGSILLFREWGRANPAYGEAMGAIFGLAASSYLTQLGSFGAGIYLARRAGLPVKPLFYASFDARTAKEMLSYGARMTVGQLPNKLSFAVNNYILKARLLNYSELSGIWGQLDGSFLSRFKWQLNLTSSGVPAFSEAFGGGKRLLVRYYVARFFQYSALFSAIIFALVVGAGATYVEHALDPQWARIADYILPAALIGLLLGPSWLSDALQQGAGRPGLFGALVFCEQLARIALLLLFVERLQFYGFLLAIAIPLSAKTVIAWALNHRKILRLPFYPWPHLLGPALVGLALYGLFAGLSPFVGSDYGAMALFFGGGVVALVLGFFLAGFLGIFDAAAQEEMERAAGMTGAFSPLVRALPWASGRGRRLSPFGERFAIPLAIEAAREAEELEARGAEAAEAAEVQVAVPRGDPGVKTPG